MGRNGAGFSGAPRGAADKSNPLFRGRQNRHSATLGMAKWNEFCRGLGTSSRLRSFGLPIGLMCLKRSKKFNCAATSKYSRNQALHDGLEMRRLRPTNVLQNFALLLQQLGLLEFPDPGNDRDQGGPDIQ